MRGSTLIGIMFAVQCVVLILIQGGYIQTYHPEYALNGAGYTELAIYFSTYFILHILEDILDELKIKRKSDAQHN